ncbi:MAG: hypothetical protein WCG02_01180 [Candidatus Taylorbacteria bacterium]
MKDSQKGFVVPLLIAIIALLVVGGGVYVYQNNRTESLSVVNNIPPIINEVLPVVNNTPQQSEPAPQTAVQKAVVKPPTPNIQQVTASNWKTYSDASISFEYPALLSIKNDGGITTLNHSIAYTHSSPCDFKGDAPPLDRLVDFGVSLKIVNQNIKDHVSSSAFPGWDYVSKNPFTFGSLNGYMVSSGIEGCGEDIYYLTISPTRTLVIHRSYVSEFNSIIANYRTYLNLPGTISPVHNEEYFNHILSTMKY